MMVDPIRGKEDEKLDALFRAYREACPTPEPSTNFMPELWQRIEARQTVSFTFRRMANLFVTAALAMSIALGAYMAIPRSQTSASMSYIEVLAASRPLDTPDFVSPVSLDLSDRGR